MQPTNQNKKSSSEENFDRTFKLPKMEVLKVEHVPASPIFCDPEKCIPHISNEKCLICTNVIKGSYFNCDKQHCTAKCCSSCFKSLDKVFINDVGKFVCPSCSLSQSLKTNTYFFYDA